MSFIPSAFADTTTTTSTESNLLSFLPMIIIFILFWFLLIRPQQKKAKIHTQMLNELQKGDEIITSSGIIGKINKISEQLVLLEVNNNVILTIQKNAITNKVDKGTLTKLSDVK